ncbi:MAG TPA: ABC transporter substrate-binding protein [Patescibacteria group bacterium]
MPRNWKLIGKFLTFKEKFVVTMLLLLIAASFVIWVNAIYLHFTKPIPKSGGEYTEGIVGQPLYINPLLSQTSEADSDLSQLVYSGLFKYDKDGNVVPDLADRYEVSDDQQTFTVYLRKGVKWHDGKDLTAADAFFTYNILQDPTYKSPLRQAWQGVSVSQTDDYTLVFTLKNPYIGFLENLTIGILPKHVWENIAPEKFALADYNLHPIGSGPYMYTDFQKDSEGNILTYHLSAFRNYYGGAAYISKMTFDFYPDDDVLVTAYNKKEVMGMGSVAPEKLSMIKNVKSTDLHELVIPRYFAVFYNKTKSLPLADDQVRQALDISVDRKQIIDEVLHGKGEILTSPFFKEMRGFDSQDNSGEVKIDEANKLLDGAGWKLDPNDNVRKKNGSALEFGLVTTDWPELSQTAELLAKQWSKIGVKVNVQTLSVSDLQQNYIKDRQYDSLLFGQATSFTPDLYSFWHSSQKRDGLNLALFDNKSTDTLLENIRQEDNVDQRTQDYQQLQSLLSQEHPASFLYGPAFLYPVSTAVQGMDVQNIVSPSQRFVDVNKWYVRTSRVFK